jgi:response regulator RpfG family c-di-GMP phosphodiesterase
MTVDDVTENLLILEAILESIYNVIKVESGAGALELLDKGANPDLILLDLSMPEMNGFELLEKIRENGAYDNIPVIFVTGTNDVYSEEKGLDLGAVDYIKKPYEPKIIRVKIRNHIELKTYRDDLAEAVSIRTRQLEERTKELHATHSAIIMGMDIVYRKEYASNQEGNVYPAVPFYRIFVQHTDIPFMINAYTNVISE